MSESRVSVAIIGAGPAGLATAYYLAQAGIEYVILEQADHVASTWAVQYHSLRLNTASFVTYLPGRHMPVLTPIYPTGRQLYDYFVRYAGKYPFNIQYGVRVDRACPEEDGWRLTTSSGELHARCLVLASGRFSKPVLPDVPGLDGFQGRVLHARDYRRPEDFAGQRVLAVGAGPSGVDIALELTEAAALPVYLSIRSDIVIARRYPYGLPDSAWHLIARSVLPARLRRGFLDRVLYQPFADAAALQVPLAKNRHDRRGTSTPIRGRALIDAVRDGRIQIVPGVEALTRDAVCLADGMRLAVDSVVFSTGYRPALDFLDCAYEVDAQGYPRRADALDEGGTTEMLDAPGAYLVGRYYRGLGPLHNIRSEARTAAREIQARLNAAR